MSPHDQLILLLGASGIVMSWVVGQVAAGKGYNRDLWAFWGLLAWPVVLAVALSKAPNPRLFRRCLDCGSTDLPFNAPVCRHCGRDEREVLA